MPLGVLRGVGAVAELEGDALCDACGEALGVADEAEPLGLAELEVASALSDGCCRACCVRSPWAPSSVTVVVVVVVACCGDAFAPALRTGAPSRKPTVIDMQKTATIAAATPMETR